MTTDMRDDGLEDLFADPALVDLLAELRAVADQPAPRPGPELSAVLAGATPIARVRARRSRTASALVIGLVSTGVLAGGVGAAAANELPPPVQRVVSRVVHTLTPFELPHPDQQVPADPDDHATVPQLPTDPDDDTRTTPSDPPGTSDPDEPGESREPGESDETEEPEKARESDTSDDDSSESGDGSSDEGRTGERSGDRGDDGGEDAEEAEEADESGRSGDTSGEGSDGSGSGGDDSEDRRD